LQRFSGYHNIGNSSDGKDAELTIALSYVKDVAGVAEHREIQWGGDR